MQKKRIRYFDIAKGIGILSVIVGHTVVNKIALQFIYSFHMPLFFIISGYFFKFKEDRELMHKNYRRLIIPYIFTALTVIFVMIMRRVIRLDFKHIPSTALQWIYAGFYGSGQRYTAPFTIYKIGTIWFLLALFFASLIFNYSSRFNKPSLQILFILTMAYIGYKTSKFIWLPFSIQAGAVATIFLLIGFYMHKFNTLSKQSVPNLIFCASIWLLCVVFCGKLYMVRNYYGNGLLDIIGAVCAFYVIIFISKLLDNKTTLISRILSFYGRNSLAILCFHLIELDSFPWHIITDYLCITRTRTGTLFLIIVRITFATICVLVVNKIPVLKRVFSPQDA